LKFKLIEKIRAINQIIVEDLTAYLNSLSYEFITYQLVNFILGAQFRGGRVLFYRVIGYLFFV
jgi:hypothetical protein